MVRSSRAGLENPYVLQKSETDPDTVSEMRPWFQSEFQRKSRVIFYAVAGCAATLTNMDLWVILSGMRIERRRTRRIQVGDVAIGGDAPIAVQSMTNTDTRDVAATVAQARELVAAGCELVRVAVPDEEAAAAISAIRDRVPAPIIADIHFDVRLALLAADHGAHGIRINPGNLGGREQLKKVVDRASRGGLALRIGVNAGSLEKDLLAQRDRPWSDRMVESALRHVEVLEDLGFVNYKISIKSSDVPTTLDAYRLLSEKTDAPLHLGVTEAGTLTDGTVKSALGIGMLLSEGIGDTFRVSLTAPPVREIRAAFAILRALKIRERGVELISCPTCGRCEVDLISIVEQVERRLAHVVTPLKIAVMGCVVNGPGEAREADIGIAGGRGKGILFRKGELVRKVEESELVEILVSEVAALEMERSQPG